MSLFHRILGCLCLLGMNSLAHATYIKVSNSGKQLPDSAVLGSGPDDWACTYDSTTKLIWEVKSMDGGLRDQKWTYTWYNSTSPDNNKGTSSGGTCKTSGRCDTEKFIQDVNQEGLCGAKDWRLPSVAELKSLVYCSNDQRKPSTSNNQGCRGTYQVPTINSQYFINTPNTAPIYGVFWSASVSADTPSGALDVSFVDGYDYYDFKFSYFAVRLVRDAQLVAPLVVTTNTEVTASDTAIRRRGLHR